MRGFFCALFAGILCLESIGGFCRQGYVSEGIREQATHLFHETEEKEVGQLQEDLHLYAQAAVLLDADSGRVQYGKNEETPMAMASTTKIMTCILVLENAKVEEEVSISAYAATMPKVKLYVKKGEHYTVRELLFSLMLKAIMMLLRHWRNISAESFWVRRKRLRSILQKRVRQHYIDLHRR